MSIYIPKMYKKDIFNINYKLLKEKQIKAVLFDLDNTLMEKECLIPTNKTIDLLKELKKDFTVLIISNTIKKNKITKVATLCETEYIMNAKKPSAKGYKEAINKLNLKPTEIAMIGDQLVTDISGANKIGMYTILVNPIGTDNSKWTKINRIREKNIMKKLNFKVGEYYE